MKTGAAFGAGFSLHSPHTSYFCVCYGRRFFMSLALMTRALANRPLDALPRLRRRAVQILPALL